jgi:two-component system LytT family sensor kinase
MNKPTERTAGHPGKSMQWVLWRRIAESGILALMTLGAAVVTLYARQEMRRPPFPASELHFEFNPFALGVSIQRLIVPLVLIYLLGGTRVFRRYVGGEVRPRDRLRLAGMLVLIELVTLAYELGVATPDRTIFAIFVIIVGGLLGGWPVGLGLGLIGMFVSGTFVYVFDVGGGVVAFALRRLPDMPPWAFWLEMLERAGNEFVSFYIYNLRGSMSVWVGIAAGLVGGWLKERWLVPAVAFALGAALELGAGVFIALTAQAPNEFLTLLIASALLTGLGMAAFALIVRSVQAEVARGKAAEAELALARAELRALRAQIKPHFLFNALNTIRYFVRTDPEAARQLLLNLSEVFQRAIRSGEFVSLRDELSCVQAYLSLEQARLGERLKVTWTGAVTEPERLHEIDSPLLDQAVPTLSVQPIVENAVVHGVSKKPEGGTVCIAVECVGQDLLIQVEDDGVGIEPARRAAILQPAMEGDTSIGMRNVDGRLKALYGAAYGLAIESVVGQGTRVKMRIPVERG